MTDTTDIAALRERLKDWLNSSTGYADLQKIAEDAIDALEAERQRADNKKTAIRNIKNLSQQQMRDFCTRYSKDNNDGTSAFFDPNDVEWVEGALSSDYFLSIFSTRDRALKYLLDEINIRKNDGLPYADYEYLINNREENPIVFAINNGKPVLWDGFHRVAAAIYRGDTIYSIFAQAPVDNKGWEDAACAKHKENALLRDELAALKGEQVPVAVIQFSKHRKLPDGSKPDWNEMPKVVSCNWLPDGTYNVYLHPQMPVNLENVGYVQVDEGTFYLDESGVHAAIEAAGGTVKEGE